jgi:crotonobetaine/carnitine-CoA ligase
MGNPVCIPPERATRAAQDRRRPRPRIAGRTDRRVDGQDAAGHAGYYRDDEQTRAAFRDGWFLTRDLAWRDGDGYFWFVARKKDIIRKRGENISGAELDRVVESHPDVLQAAAIPVPDALGEDEILMAVALRPGATLGARAVADWCRDRLNPLKVPRYVVFVDTLPQTPTHRVAKYKLREDDTLIARAVDLAAPCSPVPKATPPV